MTKINLRAARAFVLALAALLYISGCSPKTSQLKDPGLLAGRLDLKVSAEERLEYAADLKSGASGQKAARALYFLGLAEFQDGRFQEAGKYFQRISGDHANSGWERPAVFMMAASLDQMNDAPRALVQYQRLVQASGAVPEAELSQKARKACLRILDSALTPEQLKLLIDFPALAEFQPTLHWKRIRNLVAEAGAQAPAGVSGSAKVDEAFLAIEEFIKLYPDHPLRREVEALAKSADLAVPVDRKAMGFLVPLTGRQAVIGAQLRKGVELAVDEINAGIAPADKIKLLMEDEGDNTASAVASGRKLLMENQVIGVIGPMSSDACLAVLPLAVSRRTPLFSPYAIRADLATASPYFFRNGMTPEKQAVAMADHALLDLKVTRVAALYPDTPYGQILARAFSGRVAELGAAVLVSVTYSAGNSDFKDIFVQLGGVNPTALKDADTQEKRAQQTSVERVSSVLGKAILDLKAGLASRSNTAESPGDTLSSYRPLSFPARVAVFDFSSVTSAAVYNAGRSFSDRFARVLGQLDELTVLNPEEGLKRLHERALLPESLTPELAADLGRAMNADFILTGSVTELSPDWNYLKEAVKDSGKEGRQARSDVELFSKNQVFQVTALILDARSASVVASAHFEANKMRPPLPNALGLQALYLPGKASEAVQAASAMSFCDLKWMLLGCDLWKAPELLQSDNAASLEGARFSAGFFADSPDPVVKHFVDAYKKRYADIPGQVAAQAYDAAMIMAGGLRAGAKTREELRQAIFNLHNFDGVSGRTSFDGRQDAIKRVPILKVNSVSRTFEQVQ